MFEIPGMPGASMGAVNLGDMLGKALGGQKGKPRRMTVKDAYAPLLAEESDKLVDAESLTQEAIREVEDNGIVFLDEIDKICAREGRSSADVSREGVQRDLLPLIEGTTVATKHGPGEDGPHPVHRVRRLPRLEALRPPARVAGPPADPRRTAAPHGGGFPPDPDLDGGEPAEGRPWR